MRENKKKRLVQAAEFGTIDEVSAAFEACNIDQRVRYGHDALLHAVQNVGLNAFEIVKFLIEQGVEPNVYALHYAARNTGSCVLKMAKLLIERGVKIDCVSLCSAAKNPGPCALDIVKFLMKGRVEIGPNILSYAAMNDGPCALDIVTFLMKRGAKANSVVLWNAARNTGPHVFDIIAFLIEQGTDPHEKDLYGDTMFTISLRYDNPVVADYLLSHDDFRLSDLMPCPENFSVDTYETYREKAISRAIELVGEKGIPYVKAVAADIEEVLKTEKSKLTKEDVKALQMLAKKIVSKDWACDARVLSDDFLSCNMAR